MTTVRRTLPFTRSVVYATLSDPTTYPHWLLGAQRIRAQHGSFDEAGDSFDHAVGAGPLQVKDSTELEHAEPDRYLKMEVRARPFLVAEVIFRLKDAGAGSCEVVMKEEPVGPYRMLGPLVAIPVHLRNQASLRQLEQYLGAPPTSEGA